MASGLSRVSLTGPFTEGIIPTIPLNLMGPPAGTDEETTVTLPQVLPERSVEQGDGGAG